MNRILHVILADDDAIDRELFHEALSLTETKLKFEEVSNGNELLSLIRESNTKPDLIFLDLNMPGKDGRETLRDLKSDKELMVIPVMILSTSNSHFDVKHAYEAGANLFLTKPHGFNELVSMLTHAIKLVSNYVSFAR